MGIVIRQSAKSVILTYIGIGFGIINTLWLFPYILTEEQIGLVRTIINVAVIFSTFACLGTSHIPFRFFPYFRDIKKGHNGFLFFLLLIGAAGLLIFLFLFVVFKPVFYNVFSKNAPLLIHYFNFLIPFTFILVFTYIFESYNVIQQNPIVPIFTRETLTRISITISLLLFFIFKFSYSSFVTLLISFYGFILIVLIYYTYSQHYLFIKPNTSVFKSPLLKSIFVFGTFILMGNASGIVIINIDSLMLSAYSGLRNTGIYTIAFFIATFIEIPKKSLSQVLIPLVSEANKNNDIGKLEELYKKSSLTQLIIGGFIFIIIWCNIANIFRLIPHGNIYSEGKWVVFFIGIGKLFDMATGINQEIVGTSRYYKYDLIYYPFIGIIAIGANMWLIPRYGMTGAAIAAAFSVFLFNTIRFLFILLVFKIQPFSFNIVKVLVIGSIVFLLSYFIPPFTNLIIDILVRCLTITITFIGLILLSKSSEDINSIFNKILRNYFNYTF
jgi:O-antigen/teichoic acid export membrane protein